MPRFYLDVLEQGLRDRRFRWHHPFTHRLIELTLAPDQEAVIVLWSKDFGGFLRRRRVFEGWPLFFQFTITSSVPVLEPDLPSQAQRLRQVQRLVEYYGPRAVRWRFDPIVIWNTGGIVRDNLAGLEYLARHMASYGLHDVTVSFMDRYGKIDRRASSTAVRFCYPSDSEQIELFRPYAEALTGLGFTIHTCCEPALVAGIPGIRPGRCVDADSLSEISGFSLAAVPDKGQRVQQGCGCHRSVDIGCYVHHRCLGECLYCYARP